MVRRQEIVFVCEVLGNYLPQRFDGRSKWLQRWLLVAEGERCNLQECVNKSRSWGRNCFKKVIKWLMEWVIMIEG